MAEEKVINRQILPGRTNWPLNYLRRLTMKLKTFDPLDYLQNDEDCRLALIAAYEEDPGDGSLITSTLGDIAKARGMSQLARETGLSRENLYRSLSGEGRPEFATILKVSRALGYSMAPMHAKM